MTEVVGLEIPAEPSLLPVVRMVVGGMAAKVDLSVDAIDDVHMALEELFWASRERGGGGRCRMQITTGSDSLTIELGPFSSAQVLDRLTEPTCSLVARVVELEVRERSSESVSILLTKRREVRGQ